MVVPSPKGAAAVGGVRFLADDGGHPRPGHAEFIQDSVLNGTDEGHIEFTYAIFVATLQYRDAAREAIRTDVESACP